MPEATSDNVGSRNHLWQYGVVETEAGAALGYLRIVPDQQGARATGYKASSSSGVFEIKGFKRFKGHSALSTVSIQNR